MHFKIIYLFAFKQLITFYVNFMYFRMQMLKLKSNVIHQNETLCILPSRGHAVISHVVTVVPEPLHGAPPYEGGMQ